MSEGREVPLLQEAWFFVFFEEIKYGTSQGTAKRRFPRIYSSGTSGQGIRESSAETTTCECLCACVCVEVLASACVSVSLSLCVSVFLCANLCLSACVQVCLWACVSMCICALVCVCVSVRAGDPLMAQIFPVGPGLWFCLYNLLPVGFLKSLNSLSLLPSPVKQSE